MNIDSLLNTSLRRAPVESTENCKPASRMGLISPSPEVLSPRSPASQPNQLHQASLAQPWKVPHPKPKVTDSSHPNPSYRDQYGHEQNDYSHVHHQENCSPRNYNNNVNQVSESTFSTSPPLSADGGLSAAPSPRQLVLNTSLPSRPYRGDQQQQQPPFPTNESYHHNGQQSYDRGHRSTFSHGSNHSDSSVVSSILSHSRGSSVSTLSSASTREGYTPPPHEQRCRPPLYSSNSGSLSIGTTTASPLSGAVSRLNIELPPSPQYMDEAYLQQQQQQQQQQQHHRYQSQQITNSRDHHTMGPPHAAQGLMHHHHHHHHSSPHSGAFPPASSRNGVKKPYHKRTTSAPVFPKSDHRGASSSEIWQPNFSLVTGKSNAAMMSKSSPSTGPSTSAMENSAGVICMAENCNTGCDKSRKVISHIFGRNKLCTRTIPDQVWIQFCRKHYQRMRYKARDSYALTQVNFVIEQLERVQAWSDENKQQHGSSGVLQGWSLHIRKREQKRLENKSTPTAHPTASQPPAAHVLPSTEDGEDEDHTANGASTDTAVPTWLINQCGNDYSTAYMIEIMRRVEQDLQEDKYHQFPDIEILPNINEESSAARFPASIVPDTRSAQKRKPTTLASRPSHRRVQSMGSTTYYHVQSQPFHGPYHHHQQHQEQPPVPSIPSVFLSAEEARPEKRQRVVSTLEHPEEAPREFHPGHHHQRTMGHDYSYHETQQVYGIREEGPGDSSGGMPSDRVLPPLIPSIMKRGPSASSHRRTTSLMEYTTSVGPSSISNWAGTSDRDALPVQGPRLPPLDFPARKMDSLEASENASERVYPSSFINKAGNVVSPGP